MPSSCVVNSQILQDMDCWMADVLISDLPFSLPTRRPLCHQSDERHHTKVRCDDRQGDLGAAIRVADGTCFFAATSPSDPVCHRCHLLPARNFSLRELT